VPAIARTPFRFEPLSKSHDRSAFSCGVPALDRYLIEQAGQEARRRIAAIFLLIEEARGRIAGYYTLAAASIRLGKLPPDTAKRLPKYPDVPATLLGRLAVDQAFRGQGLGEILLVDAVKRTMRSEIATFAMVVDAKDERAVTFYRKYGFTPLLDVERRLFLPTQRMPALLDL
jgi:ribosomal protein S18 acetylase RimI-like enzyme